MKVLFLLFGIALLAMGIVVGSRQLTVTDNGTTVSCGIAYQPQPAGAATANGDPALRSSGPDGVCDNVAGFWQASALGLTVVGAAMLLGGVFIRSDRDSRDS